MDSLLRLPRDLILLVITLLDYPSICRLRETCCFFKKMDMELAWKEFAKRDFQITTLNPEYSTWISYMKVLLRSFEWDSSKKSSNRIEVLNKFKVSHVSDVDCWDTILTKPSFSNGVHVIEFQLENELGDLSGYAVFG